MRKNYMAIALLCMGTGLLPARAQPVPQGGTWDSIKQLPDWSGVWENDSYKDHMIGHGRAPYRDLDPPFKPDAAKKFEEYKKLAFGDGNFPSRSDRCVDMGFPGNMNHPTSIYQILFTPGQVTFSGATTTRRVYTDGRKHDEDFITFNGDSIGHWEKGGVLVVDTIGLDPGNEFILGYPQGNDTHAVERIYLKDKATLIDEVTFDAPDILAGPYHYRMRFVRGDSPMSEIDCAQGNVTGGDDKGGQFFNLTPPPSH